MISRYMCAYMNIYIKYYIIILSHIVLYYIYPRQTYGQGGGNAMSHGGNWSPHSQWNQQSIAIFLD